MFKNILVPTDLSEKSTKALDIALSLGSKDDCRVTLVHVIETIEGDDQDDFGEFYEKLKARAQGKMDKMIRRHGDKNQVISKEILFGKRVREIVGFAYEHDIDLIILSSHKIDKIDAATDWATISYKVGILSRCPVLMVK